MEKNNADFTNTFVDLMNEENLSQSITNQMSLRIGLRFIKKETD